MHLWPEIQLGRGIVCFPLLRGGRTPATSMAWADITLDQAQKWWAESPNPSDYNTGLSIPPTHVVIDLDVRRSNKSSLELLCDLYSDYPELEETYRVATPRGGYHYWLTIPEATYDTYRAVKSLDYATGHPADVKGLRSYVVGPGSVVLGKSYVEETNWEAVKPISEKLFDLCFRPRARHPQEPLCPLRDTPVTPIKPAIELFTRLLSNTQVAGIGGRNNQVYELACYARDYGLGASDTADILIPWAEERMDPAPGELLSVIGGAYTYAQNPGAGAIISVGSELFGAVEVLPPENEGDDPVPVLESDRKGRLAATSSNTIAYLYLPTLEDSAKGRFPNPLLNLFAYDQFRKRVVFKHTPPWTRVSDAMDFTDFDLSQLRVWLEARGLDVPVTKVLEAVSFAAARQKYHPVKDYIEAETWDGVARLEGCLQRCFGVEDTPYTRLVSRLWFCAAVARIYRPGCQSDNILTLGGPQGYRKSSFFRQLGAVPGWAGSFPANALKSLKPAETMGYHWFLEIAELATMRLSDLDAFKAFITSPSDTYRVAYGRITDEHPRSSIFCATYNPTSNDDPFRDPTGERRFWPVTCFHTLDTDWLEANKRQMWAEAYYRTEVLGERWWPETDSEHALIRAATRSRMRNNPWVEILGDYLAVANPHDRKMVRARTLRRVLQLDGELVDAQNPAHNLALSEALAELGYKATRKKPVLLYTHENCDTPAIHAL